MNKKSKKTLKNAFNIPEPKRKNAFLESLDSKPEKRNFFNKPLYLSTALTFIVIFGIWNGIKNLPYFEAPENIEIPSYSESIPESTNTEKIYISTTKISVADSKNTKTTTTLSVSEEAPPVTTLSSQGGQSASETLTAEKTTSATTQKTTLTTAPTTKTAPITTQKTTLTTAPTTKTAPITTQKTTLTTALTTKTSHSTTKTTTSEICLMTTTLMNQEDSTPPVMIYPTTTSTTEKPVHTPQTVDYTVTPQVRYYPDDNAVHIDSTEDNRPNGQAPAGTPNGLFYSLIEESDAVVLATVSETIYTSIDGRPYTQYNILIHNIFYDNIYNTQEGSVISVYSKGGYIPACDFYNYQYMGDAVIFDYAGSHNFAENGGTYLFFLKRNDGFFPENSCCLTTLTDESIFRYYDNKYISLHSESMSFSADELNNIN